MIEGGCFCGNIRYAIEEGEYLVVNCHCTMCRKTSAAAFVTWLVVTPDSFKYVQGTPAILKSSLQGTRHFCPDCGTPLTFQSTDRVTDIDVTTGSLDEPNNYIPRAAVHEESKLKWLQKTE